MASIEPMYDTRRDASALVLGLVVRADRVTVDYMLCLRGKLL